MNHDWHQCPILQEEKHVTILLLWISFALCGRVNYFILWCPFLQLIFLLLVAASILNYYKIAVCCLHEFHLNDKWTCNHEFSDPYIPIWCILTLTFSWFTCRRSWMCLQISLNFSRACRGTHEGLLSRLPEGWWGS